MPQKHTKQNRFIGGFVKRRPIPGGQQTVTERDIIALDGCWCGKKLDHDWPDKSKGAPHPREGVEVDEYVHERLKPNEIKGFTKDIRDLLLEIVNDHEVRYRVIDGATIQLYPPDGVSRPFKVSANRQDKVNRQILEVQFMQEYGLRSKKVAAKEAAAEEAAKRKEAEMEIPDPKEQDVTTTAEAPVETAEYVGSDVSDAIRAAIAILTESLGIGSLEAEALEALDENDALLRQRDGLVASLEQRDRELAAEKRETARLKREVTKTNGLLDEAVKARDKAQQRFDSVKELFRD